MSKKVWLSYSTLNNFYLSPHSWLNRLMGIKQPETPAMTAGKEAHRIVIDHVCGIKKDERIPLDLHFEKPEYKVFADYKDEFGLYGFVDAISYKGKIPHYLVFTSTDQ